MLFSCDESSMLTSETTGVENIYRCISNVVISFIDISIFLDPWAQGKALDKI